MKKKIILIIFLFILFVLLFSISLLYINHFYNFLFLDVSDEDLGSPFIFSNLINPTSNNLSNNPIRILITVPHSQSHSKHINLGWHTTDFAAVQAMNYLKYFLEKHNIIVHSILSEQNRFSLSNNTINNGLDDNRIEGCLGSKIIPNLYENYLNCRNPTPLWKNLIHQLKSFRPHLIIDCHSFPDNISEHWKHNLEIFMPPSQSKKIKHFLINNISSLHSFNIGVIQIFPSNHVNAITEFCNQHNLNSALFEFKELSDSQIKQTCSNIVHLLHTHLFPTLP